MAVAERLTGYLHHLLIALRDAPAGETAFWARMADARTPLIEADPSSSNHSVVTFVFRDADAERVVFNDASFGEVAEYLMDRIAGTAVWYIAYRYRNDVRLTYSFSPNLPVMSFKDASDMEIAAFWAAQARFPPVRDANARETFTVRRGAANHVESILSLPDAPDQTIIERRVGILRGQIDVHLLKSEILGNERRIWVYTPPCYAPAEKSYPLLVVFDGAEALSLMPTHHILDNLLDDGRIAPTIAVFVDTSAARNTELPCSEPFARFVETELIQFVRARYSVSRDAKDGFAAGTSYGGLAAFWLGLRLPHVFGNVIAQSASLWWGPGYDLHKAASQQSYEPEWLIDQYERAPRLPLRIWQEFGLIELEDRMIQPNRRMETVLRAKGYGLTYNEFASSHDWAHWRVSLAHALIALMPPD